MVDRAARDKAATAVERFWAGEITNDELEKLWPNSRDRAVVAVESFIWLLYSDLKEHRIRDEDKSDPEIALRVGTCIRFLRCDEEYGWPHLATPFGATLYSKRAVWASFGLLGLANHFEKKRIDRYWRDMNAAGDPTAWPFLKH